ncbi:hypothetical protein [Aquimarina spongiae]|nr:hypothetical protein [Aquimarina spongiae]
MTLILVTITTLAIIACSSDDHSPIENEDITSESEDTTSEDEDTNNENVIKLYKKSEMYRNGVLVFDKVINYNSENKIQSIITTNYEHFIETITATYSENTITSITKINTFKDPDRPEEHLTFEVIMGDNIITLKSNTFSVEIKHSDGYVDSTRRPHITHPNITLQKFTRDSNQNLLSNTAGDDEISTYYYSDFDSDKKVDPLGSVTFFSYADFFRILGLKVTKNNPLTSNYNGSGVISTTHIRLEYDASGYVTRTFNEPNTDNTYIKHEYIEL